MIGGGSSDDAESVGTGAEARAERPAVRSAPFVARGLATRAAGALAATEASAGGGAADVSASDAVAAPRGSLGAGLAEGWAEAPEREAIYGTTTATAAAAPRSTSVLRARSVDAEDRARAASALAGARSFGACCGWDAAGPDHGRGAPSAAASSSSCSSTDDHRLRPSRSHDRRNHASSAGVITVASGQRSDGGTSGSAVIFVMSSAIVGAPQYDSPARRRSATSPIAQMSVAGPIPLL